MSRALVHSSELYTEIIIMNICSGLGVGVGLLIPWAMLPDVMSLDELKTGQKREGLFYSFFVFLKMCLGIFGVLILCSVFRGQNILSFLVYFLLFLKFMIVIIICIFIIIIIIIIIIIYLVVCFIYHYAS